MLFTEEVEQPQDEQYSSEHYEETDDVHNRLYKGHDDLRALDIAMADLLSLLRREWRSVLRDLADYRGGLDYDGHNTQYHNDITGPRFVVVSRECGIGVVSVM